MGIGGSRGLVGNGSVFLALGQNYREFSLLCELCVVDLVLPPPLGHHQPQVPAEVVLYTEFEIGMTLQRVEILTAKPHNERKMKQNYDANLLTNSQLTNQPYVAS